MGVENGSGGNPEINQNQEIEALKKGLVESNFLDPSDEDKDKLSDKIGDVFKKLKHGTENVGEINETINDDFKTGPQVENAKADKEKLEEAVYLAVEELSQNNPSLKKDFFLGSKHIDTVLPDELKGLGKELSKRFIDNEEIDKQLNLLERTRSRTNFTNKSEVATFVQKLRVRIDKLLELDFDSEEDIDYQDAALTHLNEELAQYGGMDNRGRSGVPPVVPTYDDDGNFEGNRAVNWQVSPENAANVMKYMSRDMRWSTATPPEWFTKLDKETKGQVLMMVQINSVALNLRGAGKDLDKIIGDPGKFEFSHEDMNDLFTDDFKMATHKILTDLCELYTDQNGIKCLRYKEKFYKYDYKEGDFIKDKDGRRIEIEENEENKGKGVRTIDQDVMDDIRNIDDFKDKIAMIVAENSKDQGKKGIWEKNRDGSFKLDNEGKKIPGYLSKMTAYSAWNLVYGMGDTSTWDRLRVLPTYGGIISDGLRTLNPEYKALAKWQILKGGVAKDDESLFDAEYFSGPMADYVIKVMKIERDTGPIDGEKTLRQKIIDGEFSLMSHKTFYGFFDFFNQGRDLSKDGREVKNLSEIMFNYDPKNEEKNKKKVFDKGQVPFMNEFRDSLEGAMLANRCITGKENPTPKELKAWARNFRDKFGMINGIRFGEKRLFSYTNSPWFLRDVLIGTFGAEENALSSDHVRLKRIPFEDGTFQPYSRDALFALTNTLGLNKNDFNLNETLRLLGVKINDGENANSFLVIKRNERIIEREMAKSRKLQSKYDSLTRNKTRTFDKDMRDVISEIRNNTKYEGNSDFDRLKRDFSKAVSIGSESNINSIAKAIRTFVPKDK